MSEALVDGAGAAPSSSASALTLVGATGTGARVSPRKGRRLILLEDCRVVRLPIDSQLCGRMRGGFTARWDFSTFIRGPVMHRRHFVIALVAVAFVAAAAFGLTELAAAGYPFTGSD